MKHTIPKIYLKQLLPLAILFVFALIIWYGGPLIAIADTTPLLQPERRFYIITVFFVAWFIKFIFFDHEHHEASPLSPEMDKKIQTLNGRFQGALDFLEKTFISKHGKNTSLAELPWYLLIGTKGTGKTTLLANSTVNFILAKQFKQDNLKNISASLHCDFWATRDLVVLDVPGAYITNKENTLWNSLTHLIIKHRKKESLSGAIITLHMPELMKKQNQQEKKQIASEIKQCINQLRELFGAQLPFYLVITKCDYLPGFLEHFTDCGTDELTQAWGITIPPLKNNEKLHEAFAHRFNALIRRINKQLIWRMHQERNPSARPAIKDFPLQVERLKENVTHFLKALMVPDLRLQGVYLTSATQSSQEEAGALAPTIINPHASQALQLARLPVAQTRAYFIRQLILQGLTSASDHVKPIASTKKLWERRAAYAVSIGAIVAAAMLLGRDFQHSIQQVYSLQNDLAQYQLSLQQLSPQENHLVKALPLLNALRSAAVHSRHSLSRFMNVWTFYSNKSEQTANTVYAKALQTIVLPEIKNELENFLQTTNNSNPVYTYMVLKAYLMLGDAQNLQVDFIATAMKLISPTMLSEQASYQLIDHIQATFVTGWQPLELNADVIEQTRKQLYALPATTLGFVILKNMGENNQDSSLNLGIDMGNAPVFTSKQVLNKIPTLFTANAFSAITSSEVITAATEASQGNWILGAPLHMPDQAMIATLTEQLRSQYIASYLDVWETMLANIRIATPDNLTQMSAMVANLTSSTSPLMQLLQTISQNTSFSPIVNANPKFQALNTLFANSGNTQQNALYPVFVSLRQLDFYLQNILHTTDTGKAAFEIAKNRAINSAADPISQLRTIAEQSPEPIRNWLNQIATQSWKLILQETGKYIDNSWRANITPTYHAQLANRFPFNQNATDDIDLQQFVNFVGQPGMLSTFYQTLLKPFVMDTDKKWQWRVIDNQKIPFSEMALEQIQQVTQIQHAFFPNGDNKLFVPFTLEPVSIDARIKNFNLNINGQQVGNQKQHAPKTLAWPSTNGLHATTLSYNVANDPLTTNVLKGDWGLFRLVMQSTRQVISARQLLLDFDINGHTAKYMLYTQGRINPFLPINVSHFELPDQLMTS